MTKDDVMTICGIIADEWDEHVEIQLLHLTRAIQLGCLACAVVLFMAFDFFVVLNLALLTNNGEPELASHSVFQRCFLRIRFFSRFFALVC